MRKLLASALLAVSLLTTPALAADKCETFDDSLTTLQNDAHKNQTVYLIRDLDAVQTAPFVKAMVEGKMVVADQEMPVSVRFIVSSVNPIRVQIIGFDKDGCAMGAIGRNVSPTLDILAGTLGVEAKFPALGFVNVTTLGEAT